MNREEARSSEMASRQRSGDSIEFYSGPDLQDAARRTKVTIRHRDRFAGIINAPGIALDVIKARQSVRAPQGFVYAHGRIKCSLGRSDERVCYAGDGTALTWAMSRFTGSPEPSTIISLQSAEALADAIRSGVPEASIAVVEAPRQLLPKRMPGELMLLPAWTRMRVPVRHDWAHQLAKLKRRTRQEIARYLRKFSYTCRLTHDVSDCNTFYETLYEPHVRRRHGSRAIVVGRDRFLREFRRGGLLELRSGGDVVAGAVLRRVLDSMAVLWTGASPEVEQRRLSGTTDVLDYFSLLHAHLHRCRWLDFGRSRPDLFDGIVQYKRKWGAEATPGLVAQAQLAIAIPNPDTAVPILAERYAFVSSKEGKLTASIVVHDIKDSSALDALWKKIDTPGIDHYRFIVTQPAVNYVTRSIRRLGDRVQIVSAESAAAAIHALAATD